MRVQILPDAPEGECSMEEELLDRICEEFDRLMRIHSDPQSSKKELLDDIRKLEETFGRDVLQKHFSVSMGELIGLILE